MSGSMIEVAQPGLLTTVQDLGRWGYQGYGVPVCGALDPVSLRILPTYWSATMSRWPVWR